MTQQANNQCKKNRLSNGRIETNIWEVDLMEELGLSFVHDASSDMAKPEKPNVHERWAKLKIGIFENADDADDEESAFEEEVVVDRAAQIKLLEHKKEDHVLNLKKNILQNIRPDHALAKIITKVKAMDEIYALLEDLNTKTRLKVLKQTFGKKSTEYKAELKAIKDARKAARAERMARKAEKKMSPPVPEPSSEPEVIIKRGISFY